MQGLKVLHMIFFELLERKTTSKVYFELELIAIYKIVT